MSPNSICPTKLVNIFWTVTSDILLTIPYKRYRSIYISKPKITQLTGRANVRKLIHSRRAKLTIFANGPEEFDIVFLRNPYLY